MILTEYDEEKVMKMFYKEAYEEASIKKVKELAKNMKHMLDSDGTPIFTEKQILLATGISKEELEQL